jgi:F-type H+-transporting ATPase subunit b
MHYLISIFHELVPLAYAADVAPAASSNVATMFGLNWNLFIAQLVNFGIVLFILWKWVFGPLGKKLSERTEKIEKSLLQAKEIEQKHKEAEAERLAQLERARKEAGNIIERAEKLAVQTKEQILAEAKQASEKMIAQTKASLQDEKNKLMREVREEAANLVVAATEKIIRQKLDLKKDQELIKQSLSDKEFEVAGKTGKYD